MGIGAHYLGKMKLLSWIDRFSKKIFIIWLLIHKLD